MNAHSIAPLQKALEMIDAAIKLLDQSRAVHFTLANDPELFTEKADLKSASVDQAVDDYLSGGNWPATIDAEQTAYLLCRLTAAKVMLQRWIAEPVLFAALRAVPPALGGPDVDNDRAFFRWLLIQAWHRVGKSCLEQWATLYLKEKNPPPAREPFQKVLALIDAAIESLPGAIGPRCDDRDLLAEYLIAEAQLHSVELDQAVDYFQSEGKWPAIDAEQSAHLLYRLAAANSLLQNWIDEPALFEATVRACPRADVPVPDVGNDKAFFRWLLIPAWRLSGSLYLEGCAANYLRENPPPEREQSA